MWRGTNRGGSQMILTSYEYDPETKKIKVGLPATAAQQS